MKIGCLLSVREKATRLPKKVLLNVGGMPLTTFLLRRLSMAKGIDRVILSTSVHPDDEVLVELAKENGFDAFQGSEDDKLDRYFQTAKRFGLGAVVVVDGDDPFCFPEGVALVAAALREGKHDCVYMSGYPLGAASTGLTTDALKRVLKMKDDSNTEVWGGYFIGSGRFNTKEIAVSEVLFNHPEIRLTVDYQEDYDLVSAVMDKMNGRTDFDSRELMELLTSDKELTPINQAAQAMYEAHLENSTVVRFNDE